MAGLHLVFSLLFICFISCTASPRDLSSERPPPILTQDIYKINYHGLAQILYDKEQLCSGIHIKPWIVLTIADCVIGRDVYKLEAGVRKEETGNDFIPVPVERVTIHAKYRKGRSENNFALLNIYGKMEWKVYEFQFSSHFVSYDEIMKNGTNLVMDKWLPNGKNLFMEWKWFGIFKNDSICGTCKYDNCYCGYYLHYNPELLSVDVGTPMYYNEGEEKICLGLDTGTSQAKVRVFQEIYSIKKWVEDFVRFNCAPPEDKV